MNGYPAMIPLLVLVVAELAGMLGVNLYTVECLYMDTIPRQLASYIRRRAWGLPASLLAVTLVVNIAMHVPLVAVVGVALGQATLVGAWAAWWVYRLAQRVDACDEHNAELKQELDRLRPRKLAEPKWFRPEVPR